MSELLAKDRRIVERCRATIAFVSTVFHGHATDMNVHPTDDRTTSNRIRIGIQARLRSVRVVNWLIADRQFRRHQLFMFPKP